NIRSQIATHYPGETFDISIEVTEDGTVTLGGKVNDNDKRTRIGTIARETPGVRRVVNNITVGS
ncbi:MAG TPA: BON domain-containing protein, partial [Thermoanaerobaculia bacterium]|nr:BON domain-containing protein [Thermoanaerobaculia bacterium]